jgi:two-component system chemotaxis response regulator CheB
MNPIAAQVIARPAVVTQHPRLGVTDDPRSLGPPRRQPARPEKPQPRRGPTASTPLAEGLLFDPTEMPNRIRVLLVDDSSALRKYLSDLFAQSPDVEVSATAATGRQGLARLADAQADVVLLDVEMPDLDGLATLRVLRRAYPRLPVIMCSSLTYKGAAATFEALALGANDYIAKPTSVDGERGRRVFEAQLLAKVRAFGALARPKLGTPRPRIATEAAARARSSIRVGAAAHLDLVAIGISTGGPNALAQLIPALDRDLPVPVLIVQHMPALFTTLLAERLSRTSQLEVCEAHDGQHLRAGVAYIAPGDFHLELGGRGDDLHVRLLKGPHENSFRPAVDVMLRSAAQHVGAGVLAMIMTGIGRDGLAGCEHVRAAGGEIVVQDETTSVVWDMPGAVAASGLADEVLPLPELASAITRRVMRGRVDHRAAVRGESNCR